MIEIVRSLTRVDLRADVPSSMCAPHPSTAESLWVLPRQALRLVAQIRMVEPTTCDHSVAGQQQQLNSASSSTNPSSSSSSSPSSHFPSSSAISAFLAELGASDLPSAWASAFSRVTILPLVVAPGSLLAASPPSSAVSGETKQSIENPRRAGAAAEASAHLSGCIFVHDSPAQHDVIVPSIAGPICVVGVPGDKNTAASLDRGSAKQQQLSRNDGQGRGKPLSYSYSFDFTVPCLPQGHYSLAFRLFFAGPSLLESAGDETGEANDGSASSGATLPNVHFCPWSSHNLQFLGTLALPVEVGRVLACEARSFAVQPHRVIIEVTVKNLCNRAVTIDGVLLDLKSTWIGPSKGSLDAVPSLPQQKVAPKAIDIPSVELLEECTVLSPLNVNDTTPLLQPCEEYAFVFSIALKAHLVHLSQKSSLSDEFSQRLASVATPAGIGVSSAKVVTPTVKTNAAAAAAVPPSCFDAGESSAKLRRIAELLRETFVSSVYVQHSAMGSEGAGQSSELEMETTVKWSFLADVTAAAARCGFL
jgi:hypothetical protein